MENKNSKELPITYSPLTFQDIPRAIQLHEQFLPSAGAKLGTAYLKHLYRTLLTLPENHTVIGAYINQTLVGLICATNNIQITDKLLDKNIISLVPAIILGIAGKQFTIAELFSHTLVHRKIKSLFNRNTLYILGIVVNPQFHRKKIGSGLFKKIYDLKKPDQLLIDALQVNTQAKYFYQKIGFVEKCIVADSIIYCRMT